MRGQSLAALGAVSASPKQLLPRIKAALEDPAPPVRAGALRLLPLLEGEAKPLMAAAVAGLRDPDPNVQRAAIEAVGPGAEEAVPTLIERLSDEPLRPLVVDALFRLGPAAAPATRRLGELLPGAPEEQRLKVLKVLTKIGPGAQGAIGAITGVLTDASAVIRSAALVAFAAVEADLAKKIPTLAAALDDPETRVRNAAMTSLGALGEKAADTAPQLVKRVATDTDRAVALDTLRKIQVRDVASLIAMLKVSDGNVRVFACDRLAALGPAARDALPALQTLLKAGAGKQVEIATQRTIDKLNASAAP
jgi:HEAT repeat protein